MSVSITLHQGIIITRAATSLATWVSTCYQQNGEVCSVLHSVAEPITGRLVFSQRLFMKAYCSGLRYDLTLPALLYLT